MKPYLLLLPLLLTGCAEAQNTAREDAIPAEGAQPQVVQVGAGSYASFPPPEVAKVSRETLNRTLYLTPEAVGRPVPTNQWWTNLLIDRYAGQLWSFPHQTRATRDGLVLFFPNRWNGSGSDPVSENPLRIVGANFAAEDARAKNWSDWLVQFRLAQSPDRYLDVTLGRGLPYLWVEPTGVDPILKLDVATSFFSLDGTSSLPSTTDCVGITFGGRSYGLFMPPGSGLSRNAGDLQLNLAGNKKYFVLCPLAAPADLALFKKYAGAIPRSTRLDYEYSPEKAQVVTRWHLETELLQGTEKKLLQGWLPHHYRDTIHDLSWAGPEYLSPRGTLKLAAGTDFSITYPFRGLPTTLPAPRTTGLANDYDADRMKEYVARYATRTQYGADTYWGGKHLLQFGQYLGVARAIQSPDADKLQQSLKTALTDWLTYTPGEKDHFFARYPRWRALIGFNTSYGSENFNDQHFHYGYFTTAGAMLGMDDPSFLPAYGPMLRQVAKQYANWEREDKNFPFLRTFDIWEGHSWAGGFSGPTGDNQESSSEAMQSWAGLFWLGEALGDKKMSATGAMGYAMEARATQEYWFNQRGGNWSPNWKHEVVGMVWSGGNLYGTYFSGDPAWIWGIQWLPMTPALAYLVEDPAFAKKSFGAMWAARKAKEGDFDIEKLGPALGNVILGQGAQVNPDWVAAQMDELWAANSKVAKDNDTPGLTYYLAHTNRTLGQISWDTHLSLPLSRAYYNPRTKTSTYLAFNPGNTAQAANVYREGKKVGTLKVPPRSWRISQTLD